MSSCLITRLVLAIWLYDCEGKRKAKVRISHVVSNFAFKRQVEFANDMGGNESQRTYSEPVAASKGFPISSLHAIIACPV